MTKNNVIFLFLIATIVMQPCLAGKRKKTKKIFRRLKMIQHAIEKRDYGYGITPDAKTTNFGTSRKRNSKKYPPGRISRKIEENPEHPRWLKKQIILNSKK